MLDEDGRLGGLVNDLQQTADQVQRAVDEAGERRFEVQSADGSVRVEVSGRGRVTAVELGRDTNYLTPDELDAALTSVLNGALQQARSATATAALASLPPRMRSSVENSVEEQRKEPRA